MKNNVTLWGFLIMGGVSLLIVALAYEVSGLLRQTQRKRDEVTLLTAREEKIERLTAEGGELAPLRRSWLERLPGTEEEVKLVIENLEAEAVANELAVTLEIDDFPVEVDIGGKIARGLTVELNLTGQIVNLRNFLAAIGSKEYFFRVERIQINNDRTVVPNSVVEGILFLE